MMYFEYNRGALVECWYRMFAHFDLLEKFEISADKMQSFLLEVCRKYQRVPFHNMTHAFNVAHVCFYVICQIRKKGSGTPSGNMPSQENNDLEQSSPNTARGSLLADTFLTDL